VSNEFCIEQVEMTSALAKQLLAGNAENNRNIRLGKVDQYVRDMLAGHWPITGETIKVDTGVPRGLHDLVGIAHSAKQSHLVAAVVRRILQWEQGNYLGATGRVGGVPTHTECLIRLEKDVEGFVAAAARGRDVQQARLAPGAPSGTAFYLFRQIDAEKAHTFFDHLISGANLTGSILALRNRFIRADRLKAHEYMALYVRTWNAWREGRVLGQVPVVGNSGRLTNQNFPLPK
jgi:hypothetical protein